MMSSKRSHFFENAIRTLITRLIYTCHQIVSNNLVFNNIELGKSCCIDRCCLVFTLFENNRFIELRVMFDFAM